jgi:hypothetical protein
LQAGYQPLVLNTLRSPMRALNEERRRVLESVK